MHSAKHRVGSTAKTTHAQHTPNRAGRPLVWQKWPEPSRQSHTVSQAKCTRKVAPDAPTLPACCCHTTLPLCWVPARCSAMLDACCPCQHTHALHGRSHTRAPPAATHTHHIKHQHTCRECRHPLGVSSTPAPVTAAPLCVWQSTPGLLRCRCSSGQKCT